MGLLDWLTNGGGDIFGSNMPFINATNSYAGPGGAPDMGPPPAPPAASPPNLAAEGLSLPPGMFEPKISPPPFVSQSSKPIKASLNERAQERAAERPPGIPMPQPRPPGADAAPTSGMMPPAPGPGAPPLTPAGGQDIVRSYEQAGGNAFAPPQGSQAQTMIGRALGLDPNRESQIRGSLGAGLKSVGENYNKPGLAAFAGSAGAGIEGGKKADEKTTEQQDKYLQRAIQAKKAGNEAEYQQNYLRYQIESTKAKLAAAKEKAASGAGSVMNSPEQLYLRGVGATNADGELKILANKAREAEKLGDAAASKAAMDAYNKRRQEVLDGHLRTLGVDPAKVKGMESKPGFSEKNPVKEFPKDPAAAQKAFDALPEGAYFINPKDGRLLMKKSSGGGAAANPSQPQQAGLTPPIPPMPTTPELETAA